MGEKLYDLDEIDDQLKNFDESLFKIEGGRLDNVEAFITQFELGKTKPDAYLTAAKLMCGDVESVSNMIEDGISADPESIHFWCNKAMYHVKNKDKEAASAALTRVKELRKMTGPLLVARRDHAYWIAERGREKRHYLKAIQVFEDIMHNKDYNREESFKPLVDIAAKLYLKILVRFCKNRNLCEEEEPQWFADHLHTIVNNLIRVWNSSIEEKENFVFSWLVEAYGNYQFQNFIASEVDRLSREIRYSSITREKCLEKAEERALKKMRPKFLARTGKNWFDFAKDSKEQNKKACLKALELCELSLQTGAELYMAYDVLHRVHMYLWALDYYNSCRHRVHSEYKDVMGGNDRIPPWRIQKFLTNGLFFVRVTEQAGKEHLEKAHEAMETLHTKFKGWQKVDELARVKYLLDKPDSDVGDLFTKALESLSSVEESFQCDIHLKYARFLEKTEKHKAKHHYEEARKIAKAQGKKLQEAEYRLLFLQKY